MSSNHVFSAFSFIGFVLVMIPLPWHLYSWNVGTVVYMLWTGVGCLKFFIDSIIWDGNAINWAPVWCDISSRIQIAANVGLPAASLCINRRLYHIATTNCVTTSSAERRRMIWTDLAISLGLGLLAVPLQYIVQGHRFNIFEDVGCYPFTVNTPPAYILVYAVPLAISVISACYCMGSIYQFNQRRNTFNQLLASNNTIRVSRYWRLMALAGIEAAAGIPLSTYAIVLNASVPVRSYISWESIHLGFSRVDQFPGIIWRADPVTQRSIEMSRWLFVACAFVFFAFFGFADEALKNYKRVYLLLCKSVGYTPAPTSSTGGFLSSLTGSRKKIGTTGSIPVFGKASPSDSLPQRKRTESLDSFSTDDFSDSSYTEKDNNASFTDASSTVAAAKTAVSGPGGNGSWGAIDLKDVGGLLSEPQPTHQASGRNASSGSEGILPSHKISDSISRV